MPTSTDILMIPVGRLAVSRCVFDFALTLEFQGKDGLYLFRVAQPFSVQSAQGEIWPLDPAVKSRMGPAFDLFGKTIQQCSANLSGRLELEFTDGTKLAVDPSEDFEAWEFAGPSGVRAISLPGGGLSTWGFS